MEKFDYPKALAELEQIARKVEDPSTGLEETENCIKRSRELLAACREYLRTARSTAENIGK
jgi:exodeoxyribonuclease VII small subunit